MLIDRPNPPEKPDLSLSPRACHGPSEHLAGPWQAIITDQLGYSYPSVQDAIDALGEYAEVQVAVVRGTAAPASRDGTEDGLLRVPSIVDAGDVACQLACPLTEYDESAAAGARYERAVAMAAGLNVAGGHQVDTTSLIGDRL